MHKEYLRSVDEVNLAPRDLHSESAGAPMHSSGPPFFMSYRAPTVQSGKQST